MPLRNLLIFLVVDLGCYVSVAGQSDSMALYKRIQYPPVLSNAHFGVSIGYMDYNFSANQLEPGFTVSEVHTPPVAVRVNLYGREFNKNISANIHYMRPVNWVAYKNVNGDNRNHSVWMNVVGLTLQKKIPVSRHFSFLGEGGLSIVTRKGFKVNNNWVVRNANYASFFLEAGIDFAINNKWGLLFTYSFSPSYDRYQQPSTKFTSLGFRYSMRPLTAKKLEETRKAGAVFAKNTLQVGHTSNSLGYGVNNFAYKESPIPFFWGGAAEVENGLTVSYTRNIFHTRKIFSLDWGVSASCWNSRLRKDKFFTFSIFPVLRFTFLRSETFDMYLYYSIAGPAFISKKVIDGFNTGQHFTFQDLLGYGMYAGKKKKWNIEIRIGHFSNGNIFPDNEGVKVPLTLGLGYSF